MGAAAVGIPPPMLANNRQTGYADPRRNAGAPTTWNPMEPDDMENAGKWWFGAAASKARRGRTQ